MVFLVTIPIHDGSNESSERNNLGSETNSEIITKSLGHTLGNKRKYIKYRFKCKFCEKMAKIELKNMVKTRFGHPYTYQWVVNAVLELEKCQQ